MAEAFAIFGAVSGAIGLCLTVRNGIETVYQDVRTLRKLTSECKGKLQTLDYQRGRLIDWQDRWMVWHEQGQDPLHYHLWGDRCRNIHDLIMAVADYLDSLKKALDKISRSIRSKILYAFVKKKLLDIDLGKLETKITNLDSAAKRAFSRIHHDGNDIIPSGLINWIAEAFQLVGLAKETQTSSEDLYMACKDAKAEISLDLSLNFFHHEYDVERSDPDLGTEKQRSKARLKGISASAKESRLRFTFLATENRPSDPLIRIHIENDISLTVKKYQWSLPRAFGQIYSRQTKKTGFVTSGNDPAHHFVIQDASDDRTALIRPSTFESLRDILSKSHNYEEDTPQNFIYLIKLKAALQLVDCGLLFLRTSWFSQLCSCALRRQGAVLGEHIHFFRATEVKHLPPSNEDTQAAHCWCMRDPTQGMYVRRLGILLVELALETPVFDVTLAANSTDLQLTFPAERSLLLPRSPRPESWTDTFDRLKLAQVDDAYIEVIKHCLECTWTRDRVLNSEDLLREYYWKILQPLRKHYDILESDQVRINPELVRSIRHSL